MLTLSGFHCTVNVEKKIFSFEHMLGTVWKGLLLSEVAFALFIFFSGR